MTTPSSAENPKPQGRSGLATRRTVERIPETLALTAALIFMGAAAGDSIAEPNDEDQRDIRSHQQCVDECALDREYFLLDCDGRVDQETGRTPENCRSVRENQYQKCLSVCQTESEMLQRAALDLRTHRFGRSSFQGRLWL